MKRRRHKNTGSDKFQHDRTATGARRATQAPKKGLKPEETSISRQKLLDITRLDKKAAARANRFAGLKLPKLREESLSKKAKVADESAKSAKNEAQTKDGKERLQKIIASAGICSRRKAEELILLGQVTVNGEVVNTLGAKADPKEDIISVDGQVLYLENREKQYYLLNKPRGYITTTSDPQGRPTVMDLMTGVTTRVYPVGRLDYASEGLLILTNDGDIANKIMHPSSEVRRTYAVKIKGAISEDQLKQLKAGIQLSDGFVKPVRVQRGERLQGKEWVEIELTEGKNLEIRRLFAVLDIEVDRLRRTKIGHLDITHVPVGKYVTLASEDVHELFG